MDRYIWKKNIKTNIFLLRLTGLWPKMNGAYGFNLYTVYALFSFTFFQVTHTTTQLINLFFIYDDLKALTGTVFILLTKLLVVLKSYLFMTDMKTLKKLIAIIDSRIFQPKNFNQRIISETNAKFWKFMSVYYWGSSLGALTFWILYPILSGSWKVNRLPFFAWYPFDVNYSPAYEITYIYQIVCTWFLLTVGVDVDMIVAFLNMYTGTQFDILCDDIRNLSFRRNGLNKVLKCINHHRKIINFVEITNNFLNWILLMQFFTGAVSVGFSMFQLTIVTPFTSEFYSFVLYSIAMVTETFIYCWFGNGIITKSNKIVYAVYESDWIGSSVSVQKNMIFLMMNCQRPSHISSFGLFFLSLETYMKILKTAWSYFALLHNVRSET